MTLLFAPSSMKSAPISFPMLFAVSIVEFRS